MGKKRRVLRSPKFANLRTHPKYVGMVSSNKKEKKEFYEEAVDQLIEETEIEKEAEIVEAAEAPKAVKLENPKPVSEVEAVPEKAKAKKAKLKAAPRVKVSTKKKQ